MLMAASPKPFSSQKFIQNWQSTGGKEIIDREDIVP